MKIPTILGLLLLTIALTLGILLHLYNQDLNTKASLSSSPKNITVVNITDSSATITWQTDNLYTGQVAWGNNPSLGSVNPDDRDTKQPQARITHFVSLDNLKPTTNYFFKVRSSFYFYPDQPLVFRTAPSQALSRTSETLKPIIGKVLDQSYLSIDEALITLNLPNTAPLSTYTTTAGSFILPLVSLRTSNLSNYFIPADNSPASLIVKRGELSSTAKIIIPADKILPPIVLGQNIDLTDIKSTVSGEILKFDLNGDGVVNSIDLSILLDNLGKKQKLKAADLDNDGVVDQKDVDLMKKAMEP